MLFTNRLSNRGVGQCLSLLKGAIALTFTLAALSDAVSTQTPPPDIKKQLTEQGWGRATGGIYDQALAAAPKGAVKVTKDLDYGKNPRQKVDVYQPEGKTDLPVMVFFHGGGYTGSARDVNQNVHGNVLTYFARNGFLGVNADYRLAPEFHWPSGGEDVRDVVRWVKENAKTYGGNADRIYLFGHSAGASHVAQYVFDRRFQPGTGPGVLGAILMSGRYALHYDPDDPSLAGGVTQYFGSDPSQYASRSVTTHVTESRVPIMLVMSEFDQLNLAATTGELFVALCQRDGGKCPRLLQLKYHNHSSEFTHFNTSDDYFGKEIIEWIADGFGGDRHGSSGQMTTR